MLPLRRSMVRLASWPLRRAGQAMHRLATGSASVVEVEVEPIGELAARHLWLRRLRQLGDDPGVVCVVLRLRGPVGGWGALQGLVDVVAGLRAAGKQVVAFLEAPGNGAVAVAAGCDRSFVVPSSDVGVVGLGMELTFFGALLGRLGLRPDFEAAGAYKSFGEPWTRSFASPQNLEAMGELIGDLQAQLVERIAAGRALTPEQVRSCIQRAPLSAAEAVADGLVDQLAYEDQLGDWLEETHGADVRRVAFGSWAARRSALEWLDAQGAAPEHVAVLHLDGPIAMDRPRSGVGARQVVPLLQELREDDDVVAVVLHVASPGGSALASDLMWREVDRLARQKPVVACYEDVAASGGVYLAAPAREVVARPGTLTGSIGVFGGKLVAGEGLRSVGVHTQPILAAPNAALFSPSRPFTDDQRVRFRASLQRMYDGFVSRVAEGRGRTEDELEPYCRGRVWTGAAAKERGLVDRFGGVEVAVERAQALASAPGVRVVDHTPFPSFDPKGWVRKQLGDTLPGAARLALEQLDGPVVFLTEHQGQALAMWPFRVRIR